MISQSQSKASCTFNPSNRAYSYVTSNQSNQNHSMTVPNDNQSNTPIITNLFGNYPNPFNPIATISYSIKESGIVNIYVCDVKGRLVKQIVNTAKTFGNYTETWNGTDNAGKAISSGVYCLYMKSGSIHSVKKVILMK